MYIVGKTAIKSSHLKVGNCPTSPLVMLDKINAKIIETGKYCKKRSTILGNPRYFTNIKGVIRDNHVTKAERRMATNI